MPSKTVPEFEKIPEKTMLPAVQAGVIERLPLRSLEELKSRGSFCEPAELVEFWKYLVNQGRYDDTPFVKAAFFAFGLYDVWRVADPTSHAVLDEMHSSLHAIAAGDEKNKYAQAQEKLKDPVFTDEVRKFVTSLGPPAYCPTYMIQHGIEFSADQYAKTTGLRTDVDPMSAWSGVLDHLFCTQPAAQQVPAANRTTVNA